MPRSVRQEYAGAVYHAMCRGNNGQVIYKTDKGRRLFLSTLEEVCEQTGWLIHAYVLMSNHYHLLIETPEPNLVSGMKWFQGAYTQRFNAMFKCRGHLFQGRYKALPIETGENASYFRAVGNYIHLNPYRAGLAGIGLDKPLEAYRWGSYPAYIGASQKCPSWLYRDRLLKSCGFDGMMPVSSARYRSLLEAQMGGDAPADPESEVVEKQLKRGWYIGGEGFRSILTSCIKSRSDNLRREQRLAHDEMEAERLLSHALAVLGLSEEELLSMKSTRAEKQAVVWMLKKHTTITVVWLASRLNMGHRTNASRAISMFDRSLDQARIDLKTKMLQITG